MKLVQTRTRLKKPVPTFPTPVKLPPKFSEQIVRNLFQEEVRLMRPDLVSDASLEEPFLWQFVLV